MARSPPCYWTCLYLLLVSVSADQKTITAESGQNITLTCRATNENNILIVEWNRADLNSEYVLLYRDEQFDPEDQHPSFKNRVDLQDRQMKDGDVSLILKNVTTDDAGTYECRVFMRGTNRRKRANSDIKPISIINLRVDPPGHTRGHLGIIIPPSLSCVVAICIIVKKKKSSLTLPSDKASDQLQV